MSISFSTYNPEANKKFQLFKITMFIAFSLKKWTFIISEGIPLDWSGLDPSCFWLD